MSRFRPRSAKTSRIRSGRGRTKTFTTEQTLDALRAAESELVPFGRRAGPPMALVYPNSYHVGMSSLGYQTLLARLRARGDVTVERVFWDAAHPAVLSAWARRPHGEWPSGPPLSVETHRPLGSFPLIAFSIAFEMDYLHVLDMLLRAGIEPWASRRGPHDPLLVAGGASVTMNRLPIYDFMDVIVHGDGETAVDLLAETLAVVGTDRDRLRAALHGKPGFEITAPREPGDAAVSAPPPPESFGRLSLAERLHEFATHSVILTPYTEFSQRGLMEISRGCPYKCTFCIMGYQPYAYRRRAPAQIEDMARALLPYTNRVGLVASAVGVHKEIEEICERLMRLELDVSFSSLRVEDVKPKMVEALLRSGQRTLTIAPEAGNERLRYRMKKRLSDDRILEFVAETVAKGMRNIKLYYMIGLDGETDDDVLDIGRFTARLHRVQVDAARAHGRIGHLALNVGILVPKPGTPLEHAPFVGVREARRRLKLLERALAVIPNVKIHFSNPYHAAAQNLLSLGDRRAADLLWWAWHHARGDWAKVVRTFGDNPSVSGSLIEEGRL